VRSTSLVTHGTMKILTTTLFLLFAGFSYADLAVYNGAQVVKTTSATYTRTDVVKFIEVVDLANSKIAFVTLGVNSAKKKTFSISIPSDVVKTEVMDSRSKRVLTVFATASTQTDSVTGIFTVSSFLQSGGNLKVSLKTGPKIELPRNLQGSATSVSTATSLVASEYVDTKITAVLQDILSRTINDAGEDLATALNRIKADLLAKGYVDADA
jgi:hypothetical protein